MDGELGGMNGSISIQAGWPLSELTLFRTPSQTIYHPFLTSLQMLRTSILPQRGTASSLALSLNPSLRSCMRLLKFFKIFRIYGLSWKDPSQKKKQGRPEKNQKKKK